MLDNNSTDHNRKAFDIGATDGNISQKVNSIPSSSVSSSKKKILLVLILLAVATICTWYYHKSVQQQLLQQKAAKTSENAIMFVTLDDITVKIDGDTSSTNKLWLKIKISLEVHGKKNYDTISQFIPRINDILQTYLTGLRKTDLDGSFGIYKIKEEIMFRINMAVSPAKIDDVLFQDFMVLQ